MRGENEKKCLDMVINRANRIRYYGLAREDVELIESMLNSAIPNPELSKFPDFLCANGIIEHFQITASERIVKSTSSKTIDRGSEQHKELAKHRKKTDALIEGFKEKMAGSPSFDEVKSVHSSFNQPQHSHANLIESFKTAWEKHIDSLHKYQGAKSPCVFLIEHSENGLEMFEDVYGDLKESLRFDDLRKQQRFDFYSLSRDKKLLEYMYGFTDDVDMVIFSYLDGCEVIKLKNIPEILKRLPWDFRIEAKPQIFNIESVYGISARCDDE